DAPLCGSPLWNSLSSVVGFKLHYASTPSTPACARQMAHRAALQLHQTQGQSQFFQRAKMARWPREDPEPELPEKSCGISLRAEDDRSLLPKAGRSVREFQFLR